MTDAFNFFQSIFTFNSAGASQSEVELAAALKIEAQNFEKTAGEEMNNGKIARELAVQSTDSNKARALTEIAVWHQSRAREKYLKAAARFEEAGKIQTGKSELFNVRAAGMSRRAAQADSAVSLLNEFLTSRN